MKKVLDNQGIFNMIKEEWLKEVNVLLEKTEKSRSKPQKKPKNAKLEQDIINKLACGLRIKHRESGLEYTVDDVQGDKAAILNPEGEKIWLPKLRIKSEYALD